MECIGEGGPSGHVFFMRTERVSSTDGFKALDVCVSMLIYVSISTSIYVRD